MGKPICKHCSLRVSGNGQRGLCNLCYKSGEIRSLHPVLAKRKPLRSCLVCGREFLKRAHNKGMFCSNECSGKYRQGLKRFPVDSVRKRSMNGRLHWFTRVGSGSHHGPGGWIRTAKLIARDQLGRWPLPGERIRFRDRNRFNCTSENIVVLPPLCMWQCQQCGKTKVKHSARRYESKNCRRCHGRLMGEQFKQNPAHAILRRDQVGAIKRFLLELPGYGRFRRIGRWFRISPAAVADIECGRTWEGVEPMEKQTLWQAAEAQHAEIVASNEGVIKSYGGILWDRVTLLLPFIDDKAYQEACAKQGKTTTQRVQELLKDSLANVGELRAVLDKYPHRQQWEGGDLGMMKYEALRELDRAQKEKEKADEAGKPEAKSGQSPAKKKHGQRDWVGDCRLLEERVKKLKNRIRSLKRENARLERKNANLTRKLMKQETAAS